LTDKGFRAELDLRNEKIGFKIRAHTRQRVPYLLVVGDREVEQRLITVRDRTGRDLGTIGIDALVARLSDEAAKRIH
jgi:threonyl-tRNA synthetase